MPRFETHVSLPCTREALFEFLLRPANVITLNPPELNVSLIEAPEIVGQGSLVRFQIEYFGFKQQMLHEITDFNPPEGFLLREREGVLKKFEHLHRFESLAGGGSVLYETIEYEPPGGMIGFLLSEAKVQEGMEKNFSHRHAKLAEQFGPA